MRQREKSMISISYNRLKYATVLFTAVPIVIFFIGWLNMVSAIVFTALLAAAVIFSFCRRTDEDGGHTAVSVSLGVLVSIGLISVLWCFLGGQGGFVHQTDDHYIRNMIITDLTLKDWPVTYHDGENMLSYYIAYWMIPCSLGKAALLLSGNVSLALHVSNSLLLLQSSIGVFLTLLLVVLTTQTKGKYYPILAVLIFIFFSGLDTVGLALSTPELREGSFVTRHLEWWGVYFQFSSNTTCLYWVYNQTIPVWPLVLCLINEKRLQDFALLAVLAFPYGPFPFLGLVVFCLIKAGIVLTEAGQQKKLADELKHMLSPQNFLIVFAVAPVFILYFIANGVVADTSGGEDVRTGFRIHDVLLRKEGSQHLRQYCWKYIQFVVLELGLFTELLLIHNKKKTLIIGTTIMLAFCPLFRIGYAEDFAMRVSIPGLVYLCIMMIRLVIEEMPEKGEIHSLDEFARKKTLLLIACFVLTFGSATPFAEISREIKLTFEAIGAAPELSVNHSKFNYDRPKSLETEDQDGNFFASNYRESDFYRFFCKH